jgi:phosphoglycolate phosphatase-like HAD superfamily hydrolase
MTKRPIVFDLDGTLFQAHLMAVPACIDTFTRLNEAGVIQIMPTEEQFKSLFGLTEREIWELLLPRASPEVRQLTSQWMGEEEHKYMKQGLGELFPGALETLEQLSRLGHDLFIASNGTEGYVKSVCKTFGLSPFLTGIYSAGQYRTETKVQLLAHAIREHNLGPGMMVGDRSSDVDAGRGNGFVAVGCTYGYGKGEELTHAHHLIDDIRQVLDLTAKE